MIDWEDKESAANKPHGLNACTTPIPSHLQHRRRSSISSTTNPLPLSKPSSIPPHQPSNHPWTTLTSSSSLSCQWLSQHSESGEELTSSFSLPHTSDFEKILPNRMGPTIYSTTRMATDDRLQENETDPTQQLLPHTEDFDKIFPNPRRHSNAVDMVKQCCHERQEVPRPTTSPDDGGTKSQQLLGHPKEGKTSLNSADSEPVSHEIQPTMNILTSPETSVLREHQLHEATSQGISDNDHGMDYFQNLSPLTESLAAVASNHLTFSNTRRCHVTPATGEAMNRRSNKNRFSATREPLNITPTLTIRRLGGPYVDDEAARSMTIDRKVLVTPRERSDLVSHFRSRNTFHPFGRSVLSGSVEVCNRTFQYLCALVSDVHIVGIGDQPIWGDSQLFQDVKEVGEGLAPDREWLRKAPWWSSMTRSPCDANALEGRHRLLTGYEGVVLSAEVGGPVPAATTLDLTKLEGNHDTCTEPVSYRSLTSPEVSSMLDAFVQYYFFLSLLMLSF